MGKINKFTVDNVSTLKKRLKQLRERTAANKDSKDTDELLQARPEAQQRLYLMMMMMMMMALVGFELYSKPSNPFTAFAQLFWFAYESQSNMHTRLLP